MQYVTQEQDESWRKYTKRLAKLNQTNRRHVLRWLRKLGRS